MDDNTSSIKPILYTRVTLTWQDGETGIKNKRTWANALCPLTRLDNLDVQGNCLNILWVQKVFRLDVQENLKHVRDWILTHMSPGLVKKPSIHWFFVMRFFSDFWTKLLWHLQTSIFSSTHGIFSLENTAFFCPPKKNYRVYLYMYTNQLSYWTFWQGPCLLLGTILFVTMYIYSLMIVAQIQHAQYIPMKYHH